MAYAFNDDKTKANIPGFLDLSSSSIPFYNLTIATGSSDPVEYTVKNDCWFYATASSDYGTNTPPVYVNLVCGDGYKVGLHMVTNGAGGNGVYAILPGMYLKKGQKVQFRRPDTTKYVSITVEEFPVL